MTNNWIYQGRTFEPPEDFTPDVWYGFVYCITNRGTARKYIGKKFFWKARRFLLQKLVRDAKGLKSNPIGVHTTVQINTYNKMSKIWERTSSIERLYISVNRKANAHTLKQKNNLKEKFS